MPETSVAEAPTTSQAPQTQSAQPTASSSGGSGSDTRAALRGMDFKQAEEALTPAESKPKPKADQKEDTKGGLDLLAITGEISWPYLSQQLAAHGVKKGVIATLREAFLFGGDFVANSLLDIKSYVSGWLTILSSVRSVLAHIPKPLLVGTMYGIGRALSIGRVIPEVVLHTFLAGLTATAESADAVIGKLIEYVDTIVNRPAHAVYQAFWAGYAYLRGGSGASASATSGTPSEAKQASAATASPSDDGATAKADAEDPMAEVKTGFFQFRAEQPKLARWDQKNDQGGTDRRSGMELAGRIGVSLMGHPLVAADGVSLKVPYRGDWLLEVAKVQLGQGPFKLASVFEVGGVYAENISARKGQGLERVRVVLTNVKVGDAVHATELSLDYNRGALKIGGAATLAAFGKTANGSFSLGLSKSGALESGALDVPSLPTYEAFDGRLKLAPTKFAGAFSPGKADLALTADVEAKVADGVTAAAKAVRVAYGTDTGWSGTIADLSVVVPVSAKSRVTVQMLGAELSEKGFKAKNLRLELAWGEAEVARVDAARQASAAPSGSGGSSGGSGGDASSGARPKAESAPQTPDPKRDLPSLVPGFDLDWVGRAGLETAVVELSTGTLAIDGKGVEVGTPSAKVLAFGAKVLGVGARFDARTGTAAATGAWGPRGVGYKVDATFPIVPGVNASFGFGAKVEAGARLDIAATKDPTAPAPGKTAWTIGDGGAGGSKVSVKGAVEVSAGASVGIPYVAELKGELFAQAAAAAEAKITPRGKVWVDEKTGAVSESSKGDEKVGADLDVSADLSATLGGRISGRLFMFSGTLYEAHFKTWNLGQYRYQAKLLGGPGAEPSVTGEDQAIGLPGMPAGPAAPPVVITEKPSWERLKDATPLRAGDKALVERIAHDIWDHPGVPQEQREPLWAKLLQLNQSGLNPDRSRALKGAIDRHEAGPSLLMAPAEWEAYSTTYKSNDRDPTQRDAIKAVDALVAMYHEEQDGKARLVILRKLTEACDAYLDLSSVGHDRQPAVIRLRNQITDERVRVQTEVAAAKPSGG